MKLSLQGTTFVVDSGTAIPTNLQRLVLKRTFFSQATGALLHSQMPRTMSTDATTPRTPGVDSAQCSVLPFPTTARTYILRLICLKYQAYDSSYVLSVGATMIPPDGDETTREVAMYVPGRSTPSQGIYFTSSGGFSNYFSRPRYQDDAVGAYFSNYDPGYPYYNYNGYDLFSSSSNIGKNGGVYNRQGRASS